MTEVVVVCGGRRVDDHGQAYGPRCPSRYRPPAMVLPPGRFVAHLADADWHRPTVDEVVERARAGGWAVPDGHGDGPELVGTCPACRRPAPEVTELVRQQKGRRDG